MALTHITRSLREGCHLHAFRSGGGLRVIRIEKGRGGDNLVGYGEHPYVEEALELTNRTLRPIIGRMPKKSRWLTGSSSASSDLDSWLLQGLTFDAWAEADGTIVFQLLNAYYREEVPETVLQQAVQRGSAEWHTRGGIYRIHRVSYHPERSSHHYDYSCTAVKPPTEQTYPVVKTGKGKTLEEAMAAALAAPQVEIKTKAAA